MFSKITFIFILALNKHLGSTIDLNTYHSNSPNNLNNLQEIAIEKINIAFSIENLTISNQLIHHLEDMPELKMIPVKNNNIKKITPDIELNSCSLYLKIIQNDTTIIWKLYDLRDKKYLHGKKYTLTKTNQIALIEKILCDMWYIIFDEPINPFNTYLIYLNNEINSDNSYNNDIMLRQPFLSITPKKLLSSPHSIIDIAVIPSKPHNSIVFIQKKNTHMYIKRINPYGQIFSLYKTRQTISSPTANNDGLFFIENETPKYCCYNKHKTISLDQNHDYASIYSIPNDHSLLASRNNAIYKINYDIDETTKEIKMIKGEKITEKNILSTNMTYAPFSKKIIATQKINNYYQLVMYDGQNKYILTKTPYHKQDPVISPCENYVCYIAQENDGTRYVEIIHLTTRSIKRITICAGQYRFPNWIIKPR